MSSHPDLLALKNATPYARATAAKLVWVDLPDLGRFEHLTQLHLWSPRLVAGIETSTTGTWKPPVLHRQAEVR